MINIVVAELILLVEIVLDVISSFQNTNVLINEQLCIISRQYYIEWFKRTYPYIPVIDKYGSLFIQSVDDIQGTKPTFHHWYRL